MVGTASGDDNLGKEAIEETIFDPRQFMKARRPHLFSDSKTEQEPFLSKSEFDYLLSEITARQDEIRFEHFCRRLAKREICPNLIPHTGPTGGGDGKTDSETYPVSSDLAALWYVGDPELASQERWAFAFSAKKSWRTKAKSDIKEIVATGRNYTRIYFITNQSVASKKRADLQDELKKEYGVDIHILDKTWIIDCVVEHKRWDIVCLCFDLDDRKLVEKIGPQDFSKKQELAELEANLEKSEYRGEQFAEDCLEAALLARNLELPQVEVIGRFERAHRASARLANELQLFRITYKWAWTEYWWYRDFSEFSRRYEEAEKLVTASKSSFVLEDLVNLCQIGLTYVRAQNDDKSIKLWLERAKGIEQLLAEVSKTSGKSGNGFWAQTQILILQLLTGDKRSSITAFSRNLKKLLEKAQRYTEYPIQAAIALVEEFSEFILNNEAFDELFDFCMELKADRVSEATLGHSRLRRGYQLLNTNKVYRAIDQLAKAQQLLAKEEQLDALLMAVLCTGHGYAKAGLLWAAKAHCVIAASQILRLKSKKGLPMSPYAVNFIQEVISAELSLGRGLSALQWLELLHLAGAEAPIKENELAEHRIADFRFARLVLESRLEDLSQLLFLPKVFNDLGMKLASIGFLFAIGEIAKANEELRQLGPESELPTLDDLITQIVEQTDQNFGRQYAADWYLSETFILRSTILGCRLSLQASGLIELMLGETILAYTESLLSTAVMLNSCMAACPDLQLRLRKTSKSSSSISVEEDDCGESTVVFEYSFSDLGEFSAYVFPKLLAEASTRIMAEMHLGISRNDLNALCDEHNAFDRAAFSASTLTAFLNVFGENPKYFQKAWLENVQGTDGIKVLRESHWRGLKDEVLRARKGPSMSVLEKDATLAVTRDELKHTELTIYSVVNLPLWDKARWRGLGFELDPEGLSRINLLLLFENEDAGKKIFRGWRKRIGEEDNQEWLGLTIIKGTNRKNPAWYRLVVAVNEDYIERQPVAKGLAFSCSRMHDQEPIDSRNLDLFLQCYSKTGWYELGPGKLDKHRGLTTFSEQLNIKKRSLRVVDAWNIGPKDPLCLCLEGISDPVVPTDIRNPPFQEALKNLRYQRREAKARWANESKSLG